MSDILTNTVGKLVNTGVDLAANPLFSASSFAWNGKDLRRNVRYQKKMISFQNAQNREQASWSAREMPSLQMAGLRRAGLNPILAVTGSGGFHTDSANSAASVSLPSGESYVNNQSTPAGTDGNIIDDLGSLWDSAANFFSDRTIKRETKEATKEKLKADSAESKARLAEAKNRTIRADAERGLIPTLVSYLIYTKRAEHDLKRWSADSIKDKAYRAYLTHQFMEQWMASGGDMEKALANWHIYDDSEDEEHSTSDFNVNHQLKRLLASTFYNGLRSEDWSFFNQQMNAGVNAATAVGNAVSGGISNLLKAFKFGKKK